MYNFSTILEDEIYPIISSDDENNFYEYIYSNFTELRKFYKDTTKNAQVIIFHIIK